MSGLVRKLFSEEDLLELFENELTHSNNRKRSLFEEMEEEGIEEEGDSGKEMNIEDAIEELDLESMSDEQKIELAKEILSSCEEINCKDIMKSLDELMGGGSKEKMEDEEEEEEEEED
jgi:hypothetical protein